MASQKLQLIIRDAGIGSRRAAEQMIRQGRVTLNGQTVLDPAIMADPEKDHIKVNGKLLRAAQGETLYYLFNKPRNVISTMKDPEGRPCVGDFIKPLKKNLFTVGRLDFDAEGLMILTNDGALAQRLSHPSHRVARTYLVKVRGTPDDRSLAQIKKGMHIGDSEHIGDVQWTLINKQKTTTWFKLSLFEGKKNEIKRIFFQIGYPVRKIRRIAFGPVALGGLAVGELRKLTPEETRRLMAILPADRDKS
jgi:23S rRNA pseudouridine2605 synthase